MNSKHTFSERLARRSRRGVSRAYVLGALASSAFAVACSGSAEPSDDGSLTSASAEPSAAGPAVSGSHADPKPSTSTPSAVTGPVPSGDAGVVEPVNPRPDDTTGPAQTTEPAPPSDAVNWVQQNSISLRVGLPLARAGTILDAEQLVTQLTGYDPGSLLRCQVGNNAAFQTAIHDIGGVRWGYNVFPLEDQSKPRIYAGFEDYRLSAVPGASADGAGGAGVEIVKADIVAVTDAAALFFSPGHGLMVVALNDGEPQFNCATPLPGNVDQFYFHDGHLVAMTKAQNGQNAYLLHFKINGATIEFVESVDLGNVNILDSRRFNNKLVFYTDLKLGASANAAPEPTNGSAGAVAPLYIPEAEHRALHVFTIGDSLEKELYDTLIDSTASTDELITERVTPETLPGTEVSESRRFGYNMWASDHYFVVTEQITKTRFSDWVVQGYNACTASHTVDYPYEYCWTKYETRPNPEYTEPDNSGGDRSCKGTTLSDCLISVAKVANKTIQVPVGKECRQEVRTDWICDAYEYRTVEYPTFTHEESTQLAIYEYNDNGFVRLDSQVHEITNTGLDAADPDSQVEAISTSPETFDLAVPGAIQTLYFQNGYLYVISKGVLQVYAMGGSSIVRTATLPVVNESLQSSLFSQDKLFLSDFGWSTAGDHSTLKVVNLTNPGFPSIDGATHQLPGGHRSILASDYGILTVGAVQSFMGQNINALKLGLFSDPFAEEKAYLILGTDLAGTWLGSEESQLFNSANQRLMLPYYGQDTESNQVFRIGASHVEADQIVSEGAVVVPELVERVRALPGATESYLSFAANSIERLTPDDDEWKTDPVLEYLQPQQVYRLNEDEDYAEVQRLGSRCRLYFANASDINQRESGSYSEEFTCSSWGQAYANRLLFGTKGIEFATDHSIRELTTSEVEETRTKIAARPICLLSLELVDNVNVDYKNLPKDAAVTCFTPEEYSAALDEKRKATQPTP